MYYWVNYAVINNDKVVNITVGDAFDCLNTALAVYGTNTSIAKISNPDIPVQVGDDYDGEKFWRNGEEVKALPDESALLASTKLRGDATYTTANNNGVSIIDIENAILDLYNKVEGN